MAFKTSYSQNNTYITCPKHWSMSYVDGWEADSEGASLYFGSAVDAAATEMLLGKPDWLKTFYDRWTKSWNFGSSTQVFDNPDIVFAYKDFDEYVLEPKDFATLRTWAVSLNLAQQTVLDKELIDLYKFITEKKKNPYKSPTTDEMTYFNRCAWLSMKRKGKLLLGAFQTQFLPKVKKVIATQSRATIKDPVTGDSIVGYIDMVLEIDGYNKPIIFDLKTAGMPYSQEDIDLTQQLTLYAAMKGNDYNTDLVGYVVLCKNIPKTNMSTCKSCGHLKTGRHKTCDAIVSLSGKRCDGEWDEKMIPAPVVQVLVEKKDSAQINDLLGDISNIVLAMKNGVVYKNVSKCNNWYGGQCPFYKACHKNDFTGLVKKTKGATNGGTSTP